MRIITLFKDLWFQWWRAIIFSWQGLRAAFIYERAFRQELLLSIILIPLACHFGKTPLIRVVLISSVFLVLIVELLNSAIEAMVNRIGKEHHPLAGRAKDLGSAAVLVSLFNLLLVWIVIFL